jgi:rhodanese-related sulfurtransferase
LGRFFLILYIVKLRYTDIKEDTMSTTISTITPQELEDLRKSGQSIELIDVRTPAEFRECHATLARNVPLDSLDPQSILKSQNGSRETPFYIICQSGNRAQKACEKLHAGGLSQIVNVEGGTKAWQKAGMPVVRGKKAISLERQVRIAAGTLVLVGAILGWWVHPSLMGLSAFVGAGLIFSGITDSCAMAMVLAKMPWNQV